MKPRFAISFTEDGLALLHRERRGWVEVGRTEFDTPDLVQAMDYMRASALGLAPEGITSTLVLPNSQILYTAVSVTAEDEAGRRDEIAAALAGRTPYDVSELVFDYVLRADVAQVAVVARETLDEAESFAATYGLNPVAFTSVPPEGKFDSAPFFGTTAVAATILTHGQIVKREVRPVVATRRDLPVADLPAPVPEHDAEPAAQAALPFDAVQAEPDDLPAVAPLTEAQAETQPVPEVAPESEPVVEPEPEPEITPEEAPEALPEELPSAPDTLPDDIYPLPEETPLFDPLAVPVTAAIIAPVEEVEEAPIALDVEDDEPEHQPRIAHDGLSVTATDAPAFDDDLPPAPSVAASLAFASRRAVQASVVPGGAAPAVARPVAGVSKPVGPATLPPVVAPAATIAQPDPAPLPAGDVALGEVAADTATFAVEDLPAADGSPAIGTVADRTGAPASILAVPVDVPVTAPAVAAPKVIKPLGGMITAPSIPGTRNRKPDAAPTARPRVTTSAKPGAATTGKPADFKPRARQQVRGKPRYLGLILTGILLIFLAIAAALSSIYIANLGENDSSTQTATASPETAAPSVPAAEDPKRTASAAPQTPAAPTEPATQPEAPVDATAEAATEPAASPAPAAGTEPAPQVADAAATVTAGAGAPDEIRLSAADNLPDASDAGALPAPQAQGDPPPQTQTEPPPFGTVYQFDENGLIKATPEGIVTPEGVLVRTGAPGLKPPARPADLVPATAANAAPAIDAATPTDAQFLPAADPALANARPKPRPAGLAPQPDPNAADPNATDPNAEQQGAAPTDATLTPAALPYTTGPRPLPRPEAVLAAGQKAQQDQLAAASLAVAPDPNRSVLAITVSRRPQARPADMTRAVAAAVAAAARQPEPAPEQAAPTTDAQTAEADAEPEDQGAMPAVPTRASVAKQATVANVLAMSKLSLIGVYGTSSNRYAMVRQSNGSYKKVAVGDRLDGGQVAAITDSELRYQKGGRMLVLSMPRG